MRGDFLEERVPLGVLRRESFETLIVGFEPLDARRAQPASQAVREQGLFLRRHADARAQIDQLGIAGQLNVGHLVRQSGEDAAAHKFR